jgi:hypothetical protein
LPRSTIIVTPLAPGGKMMLSSAGVVAVGGAAVSVADGTADGEDMAVGVDDGTDGHPAIARVLSGWPLS